jgi:hypothetical protein
MQIMGDTIVDNISDNVCISVLLHQDTCNSRMHMPPPSAHASSLTYRTFRPTSYYHGSAI